MLFSHRPWRFLLGMLLFWGLEAGPLFGAHHWSGLAWFSGFIVAQAAFVGLRAHTVLSWLMAALSLGLLLLALPASPQSLTPAMLYALGALGTRLPRRALLPVGLPLSMLMLWGSQRFGRTTLPELLFESLGLLAVMLLGHAIASLRESRDESRALAAQLTEANAALRAQAERDAELSRLHERERLARELHDTLGHALSTLTVQLEAARRLQDRDAEQAGAQLKDAQSLARQAMQDLRAALDDLRAEPSGGLPEMLRSLAGPLARQQGWTLELRAEAAELPPQLVLALRPVVAEALMNAARHAHARRVWVEAGVQAGQLRLKVEDDGVGLPGAPEAPGHYGLRGVRERLALLGGRLELAARPEGGTRLTAWVPLRAQLAPARTVPA